MDVMTREQLENQLDIMQNQNNELVANLNANTGAIQMLQYLLSQLNSNEEGNDIPSSLDDDKGKDNGITGGDSEAK